VLLPECRDGQTEGCVEDQRQAADDIAAYVAAVAAAETPSPAPPPAPPPEEGTTGETTAGDPLAEGRQVFASAGCGSCHALADAGSSGTVGPDLDASQPSEELVVDRVTNGRGAMPPFRGQLSEEQISAVAEYVAAVAGS
jgi:mono/diheme cytochrome c family protein